MPIHCLLQMLMPASAMWPQQWYLHRLRYHRYDSPHDIRPNVPAIRDAVINVVIFFTKSPLEVDRTVSTARDGVVVAYQQIIYGEGK